MKKTQIKRIAAIDDICGYGKCSLGISIPVLSCAGIEVCPIPTSVYSVHTALPQHKNIDMTDFFYDYLQDWNTQKINLNAAYTGYLTSKKQVYYALQLFSEHKEMLKIVDPVLGDNGFTYSKDAYKMIKHMKRLIKQADIITPNLTESYLLMEKKYNPHTSNDEVVDTLNELSNMGPKNIVLTGVVKDNAVTNYIYSNGKIKKITHDYINELIHGAGDLFRSCLIAGLMNGKNLKKSVEFASNFVCDAVKLTKTQEGYENRGVSFESLLKKIVKEFN